jgi:type I restriction enzyme S subunit
MANSAWATTTLGEVIELKRGYDLPSRDRRDGPFPIVSSSGVTGYHAEARAKAPGVVIGRYGTLGEVHYITEDYWPLNTSLYIRDFKGNDPRFIAYFVRSLDFSAYSDKAAVPGLNRNDLHTAKVRLPPLPEQRAIAHILGTLDDKIELNRRMIQTLEAIARALFTSWFVDFEPVRAKADGRDPGLPEHLADLFPGSFEDSALGGIPAGWNVATLGDVAVSPRRLVKPSELDPVTPYIGLEHMPRKSIALAEWGNAASLESGKAAFRRGEILFGKLRPYFHKVGVAAIDGVCSTDIVVLTSKSEAWYGFVAGHVSSDAFVAYTNASSTGTKMPRTSWTEMARYPLALPHAAICAAFTDRVSPMIERILASIDETRTLAAVRDALLPRLVSGEFTITKAEQATEAVL